MIADVRRPAPISLSQAHLPQVARAGVPVPSYDRRRLRPRIVHIGVGGFHRAHLAAYVDELAMAGEDWGIVGLGLLAADIDMAAALTAQDCLYTLIEKGDREPSAHVVGSIIGFVHAPDDHGGAMAELIAAPATSILSLTVTESGYVAGSPTFERIATGLAARRDHGSGPLTILSCDNVPGNGEVARTATVSAAARVAPDLPAWIDEHCSFPNSMVDRITPVTSDADRAWLRDGPGIDDRWPVVAEPFRQWVTEDTFVAGRPPWADVGVLFTDRIHDWEQYKLRMLNAGHSSIAYVSALADLEFVHEALGVPVIRTFLEELLHHEAIPTLVEIPGHPREGYAATVVERFANPGVRDQIARLCIDGSAKFPTFLIPTIEAQLERDGPVDHAATALAGWARYLGVVDPARQAFDASGDVARRHAADAMTDPEAFLGYEAVFTPSVRASSRFRTAFAEAYRRIAEQGPLAGMGAVPGAESAERTR